MREVCFASLAHRPLPRVSTLGVHSEIDDASTRSQSQRYPARAVSGPRQAMASRAERGPAACRGQGRVTHEGMVAVPEGPRSRVVRSGQVARGPAGARMPLLLGAARVGDKFARESRAEVGCGMGRRAKRSADASAGGGRFCPKVLVALPRGAFVERAGSAACRGPRLSILRGAEGVHDEQHRSGLPGGRCGVGHREERFRVAQRDRCRLTKEVLVALRTAALLGGDRRKPNASRSGMSLMRSGATPWSAQESSCENRSGS